MTCRECGKVVPEGEAFFTIRGGRRRAPAPAGKPAAGVEKQHS